MALVSLRLRIYVHIPLPLYSICLFLLIYMSANVVVSLACCLLLLLHIPCCMPLVLSLFRRGSLSFSLILLFFLFPFPLSSPISLVPLHIFPLRPLTLLPSLSASISPASPRLFPLSPYLYIALLYHHCYLFSPPPHSIVSAVASVCFSVSLSFSLSPMFILLYVVCQLHPFSTYHRV